MYILPTTDRDTFIVVSQGRAIGKAVEQSLKKQGAKHYFVVNHESDEPKEKVQLSN